MKFTALAALALMLSASVFAQTAAPKEPADKPKTAGRVAPVPNPQARVVPVPNPPSGGFTAQIDSDQETYRIGEYIRLSYRVSRDAYVYVFNTDAGGETRQIFPNYYDQDNRARAGQTYRIPDRSYKLQVTPPAGRETISILAVAKYNKAMDRYKGYSARNPYPESAGASSVQQRIAPGQAPGRGYARDSITIRTRGRGDGGNQPDHGYGRLRVETNPDNAYVYLNGQYQGVTPFDSNRIAAGRYQLTLQRAGYSNIQRNVVVQSNATVRIDEDMSPAGWNDDQNW